MPQQPYKKLFTYWFSVLVYDLTVEFCRRYISSLKLREQMEGAARSGKQNIVEGSADLRTSLKTGIKLTQIANGSIEELIGDLEDFLRQRHLQQWSKTDPEVIKLRAAAGTLVRNLSNLGNLNGNSLTLPPDPEAAANFLLTLCHQLTYLLSRQVDALEKKHLTEGGYTEKLYNARTAYLKKLK
jgi:four helix bundle suffix protein